MVSHNALIGLLNSLVRAIVIGALSSRDRYIIMVNNGKIYVSAPSMLIDNMLILALIQST